MDSNKLDVSRQVLPLAEVLLTEQSSLGAIALKNRTKFKEAVSTKMERKEMTTGAIKVLVNTATTADYFDETDKAIDIDTTNILVSDVITFQAANKASKWDLTIIITEIVSATQAKAQRLGWADIAIATTDYAYVDTTAHPEGSEANKRRPIYLPNTVYNYTQIVRAGHSITGTAAQVNQYDYADIKRELNRQVYSQYAANLAGLVTSSVRSNRVIAGNEVRIAGWLSFFATTKFDNTGEVVAGDYGNVDVVNGALTLDKINDGFQYAIENGGSVNAIICSPEQARNISALENSKVNIQLINGSNPQSIGGATQVLQSPIKVGQNEIRAVYVDTRMPKDELIMFNQNNVALVPMKGRSALETRLDPTAKSDNYSLDLLWEFTVHYLNAPANTYKLEKLTIS